MAESFDFLPPSAAVPPVRFALFQRGYRHTGGSPVHLLPLAEKRDFPMKANANATRVTLMAQSASSGLFDGLVVFRNELSLKQRRDGANRAQKAG